MLSALGHVLEPRIQAFPKRHSSVPALKDKEPFDFARAHCAQDALGAVSPVRRVTVARLTAGLSPALARPRARAL